MSAASTSAHDKDPSSERQGLPLEVRFREATAEGFTVRLPVRAENVSVTRQAFVFEEAVLKTRTHESSKRLKDTIRREELHLETHGNVSVGGADALEETRPIPLEDTTSFPEDQDARASGRPVI